MIYNAIDAHAKMIKLSVDIESASFSAEDDGKWKENDIVFNCCVINYHLAVF